MSGRAEYFRRGMKDGVPIGLGYLAVSFSFGILARKSGLTTFQAVLMSALNLTSAGQFASLSIIEVSGTYLEMALSQLIINLRYCLMSCSLSQKIDQDAPFFHRFFIAYGNTDEVFALSSLVEGTLSPFYSYGAIWIAMLGWTMGTLLGAVAGGLLPVQALSALGVALYAMFCAIIVPPARKNKVLLLVIVVSMLLSLIFAVAPLLQDISSGIRVIILTVLIAAAAAKIAPVQEEEA